MKESESPSSFSVSSSSPVSSSPASPYFKTHPNKPRELPPLVPPPSLSSSVPASSWFVGITTAPRINPTLFECVMYLRKAGWEPTVYAEPDSPSGPWSTVENPTRLGVWHNWYNMAKQAVTSGKPYILTAQDDISMHPDTKALAESIFLEREDISFLSLYTSAKYSSKFGMYKVKTDSLWGACCIAFRAATLAEMLDCFIMKDWLGAPPRCYIPKCRDEFIANPHTIANSDTAIGKTANYLEIPMWFLNPSPCSHIAYYSSVAHGHNTNFRNSGYSAHPDFPLNKQILVADTGELCI